MKSVLIVDDQPGIRMLLEELFKRENYHTMSAASGIVALEIIEQTPPDCILLDMKMPGMDGIRVLQELKARNVHIPVFLMTAYEELDQTKEAMDLGVQKYFAKPFDIFEVRDAVHVLLSEK